jgi:hypothetical protein
MQAARLSCLGISRHLDTPKLFQDTQKSKTKAKKQYPKKQYPSLRAREKQYRKRMNKFVPVALLLAFGHRLAIHRVHRYSLSDVLKSHQPSTFLT